MAGAEAPVVNPAVGPLYAPFTAPPTLDQLGTTNPLLRAGRKTLSWRWDLMDFSPDGAGRINTVDGGEAHVTWCLKTLLTERFMHLVYTHDHGVEFDAVMTGGKARAITESQARHTISEALSRHPLTQGIENISFAWQGDEVVIGLTVISLASDAPYELSLAVSAGGL